MPVAETSIKCYHEEKPDQSKQVELVYETIKEHGPICCADVARRLGLEKSSVSARINWLKDEQLRIRTYTRQPSKTTGKVSNHYIAGGGV